MHRRQFLTAAAALGASVAAAPAFAALPPVAAVKALQTAPLPTRGLFYRGFMPLDDVQPGDVWQDCNTEKFWLCTRAEPEGRKSAWTLLS